MAHVNELFVDTSQPPVYDNTQNYDLVNPDTRCTCCPYGFHVDSSFVNYTDSMKRGKNVRYPSSTHSGKAIHLQLNQAPDLILHHSDSASAIGMDNDRDNFQLFGTRTERRKKKKSKRDTSFDKSSTNSHREYLDISGQPDPLDSVFVSETTDRGHSGSGQYSTILSKGSEEVPRGLHGNSMDVCICKNPHCPGCMRGDIPSYTCTHHTCCPQDTTCVECCSEMCFHETLHRHHSHHALHATELMEKPQPQPLPEVSAVFDEPEETVKIEFDPEKVNEIRQYMIKCVNRIHELEEQLRSLPVLQVRNSALREENTLLQDRLSNQKLIIEELNQNWEIEKRKSQKSLHVQYCGTQTDFKKDKTKVVKATTTDRGSHPIDCKPVLHTKYSQTIQELDEVDGGTTETFSRRDIISKISRRRYLNVEDASGRSVKETVPVVQKMDRSVCATPRSTSQDVGVGDHDIKEMYTIDPNGWDIQDIPESLYKRLRATWIASLPKPRVASAGVNNVPDYRHKSVDAQQPVKNASTGDHDIHSLYFLDPRDANEDELPGLFLQRLRQTWESSIPEKPMMSSIGVSAVPPVRSQFVETETSMDSMAVGSHDISRMYYLQPHLLRTEELPPEGIRSLREEWERHLPVKPQTFSCATQSDIETCDQWLETENSTLSSIGVGEHDVNRFYLLEYQPFNCEAELPQEALIYLKEEWHRQWEKSIPARNIVSTSTTYSKPLFNQTVETDGLIKTTSIGIGDHDVSAIYFLQSDIASVERDIPQHYLQRLESNLRERLVATSPRRVELIDRVVEYRRQCHDKSSATEVQVCRNIGFGDHSVEKVYFLDASGANENDLPWDYLNKIRGQWEQIVDRNTPVRPRLISRATLCSLSSNTDQRSIGTMSEDPQPAMFDESVSVNLDEEEWATVEQNWSEDQLGSSVIVGGTNLKAVIGRLRHTYRYEKAEFMSLLTRIIARQVRSKAVQITPQLTESSTVYGDLRSSLISRGVGEDTINLSDTNLGTPRASIGMQCKPGVSNKFSSTDVPRPVSKSTNTERRLQDQSVTYQRPNKVNERSMNTEKPHTRSVVVWADLDRPDAVACDSDDDHFIRETWEELSIFDSKGNVIRTERLPTYTVTHCGKDRSRHSSSMSNREEGGRHEHYFVSRGDSRCSSVAGEYPGSVSGGSVNIPVFNSTPEPPGAKTRDVTSRPSMDFVPRSPSTSHPHIHVCGSDPGSPNDKWNFKEPQFRNVDWPTTGQQAQMVNTSLPSTSDTFETAESGKNRPYGTIPSDTTFRRDHMSELGNKTEITNENRQIDFTSDPRITNVSDAPNFPQPHSVDVAAGSRVSLQTERVTKTSLTSVNRTFGQKETPVTGSQPSSGGGTITSPTSANRTFGQPDPRVPGSQPSSGGGMNITPTSPNRTFGQPDPRVPGSQPSSGGSTNITPTSVNPILSQPDPRVPGSLQGREGSPNTSQASPNRGFDQSDTTGIRPPDSGGVTIRSETSNRNFKQQQRSTNNSGLNQATTHFSSTKPKGSKMPAGTFVSQRESEVVDINFQTAEDSARVVKPMQGEEVPVVPGSHVRTEMYSMKSARAVSSKTITSTRITANVSAEGRASSPNIGKDVKMPVAEADSGELRPLFNTTWSSPNYANSRGQTETQTSSTVTKSSSHVVSKDGQVVERSATTEKFTTGPTADNVAFSGQTVASAVPQDSSSQRQSFESDDDSVFLKPSPRREVEGRSEEKSRRSQERYASGLVTSTQDDSSIDFGGGSLSTPTSPRLPRSIMKRNCDEEEDTHYNTLPLLRKRKGIRFSKDTKSDSVSSSSYSEEESDDGEEAYELEFVRKLERMRDERSLLNSSVIERSNLSPKMKECCQIIAGWLQDSTKYSSKQLNEAISNLRREWFIASAGREAQPDRLTSYLESLQQFNPTLLEMIVNMIDDNGNTSLHYAVSREQWPIVARLLDTGRIRVSRSNKAGYTPVMLTALCRDVQSVHRPVIQRLLASGHINQGSHSAGQTALMLAASHGRNKMVHLLLESGADPNRRDKEGSTALMCASEHGHLEAARVLLGSSHCDPNVRDNDGSTALSIALENKHRDIALLIYARSNLTESSASRSLKKS